MIYTDLTYIQIGEVLSLFLVGLTIAIVTFRFVLAFRNYIYTGKYGDFERSLMGCLMEYDKEKVSFKYVLTGYHPAVLVMDTFILLMIAIGATPLWAAYILAGLILLLAKLMRARIAVKQEFVGNLKGDQLE